MPEMVFEYILKQHDIDPTTDLTINQSIDFGSTAAAFSEGLGDYTIEFEPSATILESENKAILINILTPFKDLQMLYKKEWTMYSPTLLLKLQK